MTSCWGPRETFWDGWECHRQTDMLRPTKDETSQAPAGWRLWTHALFVPCELGCLVFCGTMPCLLFPPCLLFAAPLLTEGPNCRLLFLASCHHSRQLPLFSKVIKPAQKAQGRRFTSRRVEYSGQILPSQPMPHALQVILKVEKNSLRFYFSPGRRPPSFSVPSISFLRHSSLGTKSSEPPRKGGACWQMLHPGHD